MIKPHIWIDEVLAIGEVAGRAGLGRLPAVRRSASRWVRQARTPTQRISLPHLRERILGLGYQPGRDLLVHAALAPQVEGSLDDRIAMLRELVGPSATLLMPSHPILANHSDHAVYDVAKARSRVGLLSERFRRTPGVLRSAFPIASICALGPGAEQYTSDFRTASGGTAYGRGSPYCLLADRGGQVLYLGIDFIRALTLEHVAFDLLQGDHPIGNYYCRRTIAVIRGDASELWHVRDPRKDLEARLATLAMKRMVLRSGTIRRCNDIGVELAIMDAAAFVRWHLPLARTRGWPYWSLSRRIPPSRS